MNNELNLCEILKNCPKGMKLYSPLVGEVRFDSIEDDIYSVILNYGKGDNISLTKEGYFFENAEDPECMLWPSKEVRTWEGFKVEKPKFDPKTLQPFDRVLVSDNYGCWKCGLFSHFNNEESEYRCICVGSEYCYCIPYNEDTKHLVGTSDEAPEYYRYWED